MATILVVSGERELSDAAQSYLSALGYHVAVAPTGASAMRALSSFYVDLIVWDSGVRDVEVDDLHRWLRTDPARGQTMILFAVPAGHPFPIDSSPAAGQAIRQAAIAKPFQWDDLTAIVQRLLRSSAHSSSQQRVGGLLLDSQAHTLGLYGESVVLTPTEFRLALYLAQRAQTVVPVEELLEHVWGFYPGTGSREIVRQHIRNLRRKLSTIQGAEQSIQTFPRRGYRLALPP